MKVSVLMTLYNKGRWVEEAVHSVLAQTFSDFELLVVDDASTDRGLERVKAIGDPRIRILESAVNTGRAAAANRGYDAATGEYVAVLDADDCMHPERLAKQVAFLDAHHQVGAVGSWAAVVDQPDRLIRMHENDQACRGSMLFGTPVLYPSSMLRRSVLEAHRLRCDPAWRLPGMDYLFMVQIGKHAEFANLQEPLMTYRMGGNNMRHGRDELSDRMALERRKLAYYKLPCSHEELIAHVALYHQLGGPSARHLARAAWNWKENLKMLNRQRKLFTPDRFEAELDRRWARLFHLLADRDAREALEHCRLSRSWPVGRMVYLAKVSLKRWTGRTAKAAEQAPASEDLLRQG